MKTLIVLSSVLLLSGCGAVMTTGDHASLSGSPEGIRAMMDGFNGIISSAKASPDQKTDYATMREEHERERTKRAMTPGFLSGLFQRNGASNAVNVDMSPQH